MSSGGNVKGGKSMAVKHVAMQLVAGGSAGCIEVGTSLVHKHLCSI